MAGVTCASAAGDTRAPGALADLGPELRGVRVLIGLATGAFGWCCFRAPYAGDAARVAPLGKLSVVLVALLGVSFLALASADPRARDCHDRDRSLVRHAQELKARAARSGRHARDSIRS
jgi:hypothetical protein